MERCPVCRARWKDKAVECRRCGVDLSHAFYILERGKNLERQAVKYLLLGQKKLARRCIQQARYLSASEFSEGLSSFI